MRQLLLTVLACVSFFGAATSTSAFNFEGARTMTVPSEVSPVSEWSLAITEKGDTFSEYCEEFLEQMNLRSAVSQPTCWHIIGMLNRLDSQYELDHLAIGQPVWLPGLGNTPQQIADGMRLRSGSKDLSIYPLGRPSALHYFLIGEDTMSRFLLKDETEILSRADVQTIAEQVLRDSQFVTAVQLDAALRDLNVKLAASAGLSRYEVTQLIAEAMKDAQISDQVALDTVQNAQKALTTRVGALEVKMSKVEGDLGPNGRVHDMIVAEVARAGTTSTEEKDFFKKYLPYAGLLALLGLLLFAILFIVRVPTKTTLRQVDERVTRVTADATEASAKATRDAAEAARNAAEATVIAARAEESVTQSKNSAETFVAAAVADSRSAVNTTDVLSKRVDSLEASVRSTSSLTLQLFDDEYGVQPQQEFPTQEALQSLDVGQSYVLTFVDNQGANYNLYLTKGLDGVYLEGLTGRERVPVANAKTALRSIRRAFKTASKDQGTVTAAFRRSINVNAA